MSDLPIFKKFVQIFFQKKIWRQQTLPTYDLMYVLNFAVFLGMLPWNAMSAREDHNPPTTHSSNFSLHI